MHTIWCIIRLRVLEVMNILPLHMYITLFLSGEVECNSNIVAATSNTKKVLPLCGYRSSRLYCSILKPANCIAAQRLCNNCRACLHLTVKVLNAQGPAEILCCGRLLIKSALWHSYSYDGACKMLPYKIYWTNLIEQAMWTCIVFIRCIEHRIAIIWLCYTQCCFASFHGFPNNATSLFEHVTFVYTFEYISASCKLSAMFINAIVDAMVMLWNKAAYIQTCVWFTWRVELYEIPFRDQPHLVNVTKKLIGTRYKNWYRMTFIFLHGNFIFCQSFMLAWGSDNQNILFTLMVRDY